jgi:release factor glutamine methyltransferase
VRIFTLPGVFQPHSDTWLLAELLREQTLPPRASVLDVCTGSGALAICAAKRGARDVTAIDRSRRAVWTARMNARANGVRVRALRGDLFAPVAGERFDFIVSNPPYMPAEDDEIPTRGPERALDAGTDGRILLDRICAQAAAHLNPGGAVLLVQNDLIGIEPTVAALERTGLDVDVVERHHGPLGPVLSARAPLLEARGMLAPGVREEDVVVVRGLAA